MPFTTPFQHVRSGWLLAITLSSMPVAALAAGDTSAAQAAYQKQVARCNSGQSGEDKTTCLKEAGAALAEAKKGALGDASNASALQQNALKRCQSLPEADKHDCIARIDMGTKSGSVAGGGMIRELRTTQVEPAGSAASATGQ